MQEWLTTIFGSSDGDVNGLQMCARGTLIFLYGLIAIRLVGRRIFGRWAAADLVLSVLVGSNLSRALTGNAPLFDTIFGTTFLLILYWAIVKAAYHWNWASDIFKGQAVTLVEGGEIDWEAMRRYAIGNRDLEEALHGEGCHDLDGVRQVRLERNGDINVIKR